MRNILSAAALALASAGSAQALEARFVQMPTIGCFDRDVLRRAADMRDDERMDAAGALVGEALASGECMRLRPGLLVAIEDSDIVAGLSKVRAQGEARSIWVRYRALEEN
ncbi:MAG: hypothetical protein U1E28_13940 [Beijerinckiaceae bacterium]